MPAALASAMMPLLRRMDPERAHGLALWALRLGLAGTSDGDDPVLAIEAFGRRLPNPIGLAAGFDKDGVAIARLLRLGFGFVEAGTVTPRPQAGNPRPRLFRLTEDRAVINRMGFNNTGIEAFRSRLASVPRKRGCRGANVGINKEGADPERDYPALIGTVAPHADYVVINVSSPNTPGLRDLQAEGRLRSILTAVAASVPERPRLFVKVAPDLSEPGLESVVETCVAQSVAGLIVSNTTISRPPELRSPLASEPGGLSGAPLFRLSTAALARAYCLSGGRLTLIGCGGVFTGEDALIKIRAGAALVQLYTAFAFDGPRLLPRLKRELVIALRREGFAQAGQAVGTGADRLARL